MRTANTWETPYGWFFEASEAVLRCAPQGSASRSGSHEANAASAGPDTIKVRECYALKTGSVADRHPRVRI